MNARRSIFRFVPTVLASFAVAALAAAVALATVGPLTPPLAEQQAWQLAVAAALSALAAVGWRGHRVLVFRRRLMHVLDEVYDGNYDIDLRRTPDEFKEVAIRFNEWLARLREYDTIRADRVARANRVLNAMFEAIPTPGGFVDADNGTLRVNAAFRRLYDSTQESFTFEALRMYEQNGRFMTICAGLAPGSQRREDSAVLVAIPPDGRTQSLNLESHPFREPTPGGPAALVLFHSQRHRDDAAAPVAERTD